MSEHPENPSNETGIVIDGCLDIRVVTIGHENQRYDTVGDWRFLPFEAATLLRVDVSYMNDWRYEALVALHEIVEALLCRARNISEQAVTDFDIAYEAKRAHGDDSEPGDNAAAPYHREHIFATKLERLLAEELGVDWDAYTAAINLLPDLGL